jgi:hypothetical protein
MDELTKKFQMFEIQIGQIQEQLEIINRALQDMKIVSEDLEKLKLDIGDPTPIVPGDLLILGKGYRLELLDQAQYRALMDELERQKQLRDISGSTTHIIKTPLQL